MDWKLIKGDTRPPELDVISSPTTVYFRRNIQQASREDEMTGETITEWQYEESCLPVEDYKAMKMMQDIIEARTETIIESITEFNEEKVIDEYTAQLIDEGVI